MSHGEEKPLHVWSVQLQVKLIPGLALRLCSSIGSWAAGRWIQHPRGGISVTQTQGYRLSDSQGCSWFVMKRQILATLAEGFKKLYFSFCCTKVSLILEGLRRLLGKASVNSCLCTCLSHAHKIPQKFPIP